jgi:glucose/arabinose dehydrogenase
MKNFLVLALLASTAIVAAVACSSSGSQASDAGPVDATVDAPVATDGGYPVLPLDARPPDGNFCALPGSWVTTPQGPEVIPDPAQAVADLSWLELPPGFCAHQFATVQMTRQLRFAPDGHLFVASPTTPTTGGSNNGMSAIVVLPDDNHDGYADSVATFLSNLPSTQGLMFTGGYFYYQDHASILRVPFHAKDLTPSGTPELVTTITLEQDSLHWPKVMDIAQDGTIYVTNGSTQEEVCTAGSAPFGAILQLGAGSGVDGGVDGAADGGGDGGTGGVATVVARGFRNPIALRCEANHDVCLAAELSLDYSGPTGGREKLVPVRQGDDWGYPCCATQGTPYTGVFYADGATPDCSGVANESAAFIIGETPFGLDFEPGAWPAPWGGRAFVTLHGEVSKWEGARLVAIELDPSTGLPVTSSDLDGGFDMQNAIDFAKGWADGRRDHGRPAPLAFAPDGRLFLGDDQAGQIVWIAPVGLAKP